MSYSFDNTRAFAQSLDLEDPLRSFQDKFHFPLQANGKPFVYLCGNSLGLQPKNVKDALNQELLDWAKLGVEGHFHAKNPWMPYHEFLTDAMAKVVGAKPSEVIVMNTLSVNLHLMMVSFYNPTAKRNKIIIEKDAFPSDKFAVESQIKFHGYDPKDCLIEIEGGDDALIDEDGLISTIKSHGDELALVMIGNSNYYTGQAFDMKKIGQIAHEVGAKVGFDCAHGAGNLNLDLHNSGIDFAVWCSYKYLNSGPGSLGGAFVHERHHSNKELKRFTGWWGHNKETRFKMRDSFDPIPSTEAWQLSNPPILSMAAVKASLEVFMEAGMDNLWAKARKITSYCEFLVNSIGNENIRIITPSNVNKRGSQLSIQIKGKDKSLFEAISEAGVIADWREPDVIRISPVPMYTSYEAVFSFYEILKNNLN